MELTARTTMSAQQEPAEGVIARSTNPLIPRGVAELPNHLSITAILLKETYGSDHLMKHACRLPSVSRLTPKMDFAQFLVT